jgi:hypothetical protein
MTLKRVFMLALAVVALSGCRGSSIGLNDPQVLAASIMSNYNQLPDVVGSSLQASSVTCISTGTNNFDCHFITGNGYFTRAYVVSLDGTTWNTRLGQ